MADAEQRLFICETLRVDRLLLNYLRPHAFAGQQEKPQFGKAGPSAESIPKPNLLITTVWLARIEHLCASLGASMIRRLVMGVPRTSQEEEANAQWLTNPLLLHGEVGFGCQELNSQGKATAVDDDATTVPQRSEAGRALSDLETPARSRGEGKGCAGASVIPYTFVQQLCGRPASQESRALATAMKRVVLEDRGGDRYTNEAVWAVCVAAIHHVGVAGDAAEVVRAELAGRGPSAAGTSKTTNATVGAPVSPSPALVRAWRSAQQARAQLDSESISDLRALLIRRAYFLLFLKPWVSTSREEDFAIESHHEPDVARALRTSELVLKCLLSPAGTADTQNSGGSDVVSVISDDGTREGDLSTLLRIIQVQSERATARARGLSLAVQLLDGMGSDRAVAQILRAVTDGLQSGCPRPKTNSCEGNTTHQVVENINAEVLLGEENGERESGTERLHFMTGVECCDPESKSSLVESMAGFLRQCSVILGQDRSGDRGIAGNSLTRVSVLFHALRAVSMDYEWNDHDILHRSQLFPLVSRLVHDADGSVAAAASNVVQAVYRCAVPEHKVRYRSPSLDQYVPICGNAVDGGVAGGSSVGGDDGSLPARRRGELDNRPASTSTPFQKAFFGAVRQELQHVAEVIGTETQVVVDQEAITSSTAPMLADEADAVAADPPAVDIDSKGRWSSGCASGGDELLVGEKEGSTTTLAAAQVLALVHACCGVECGRQEFSTAGAVHALLRLILLAESEVRGWALRVCAATLPWVEPSLVDRVFR